MYEQKYHKNVFLKKREINRASQVHNFKFKETKRPKNII